MIILLIIALLIGIGFWSYSETQCAQELSNDENFNGSIKDRA